MKRILLPLIALGVVAQGCTTTPYEDETISDASSYTTTGYSSTSGGVVGIYFSNPELGPKSEFYDNYESGNGYGVYASTSASGPLGGLTGYAWSYTFDLTESWIDEAVGCKNPGVNDDAHIYQKVVFDGSINGGDADEVGGYVPTSSSGYTSCWTSQSPQNWSNYVANCTQGAPTSSNSADVQEIHFDYSDCDSTSPPDFGCETRDNIRVCFSHRWGYGDTSVEVLVDFIGASPTVSTDCWTDGTGSADYIDQNECTANTTIGFYQDDEPLCDDPNDCEYSLFACSNAGSSSVFDIECTVEATEGQFGAFASHGSTEDKFVSPAY
jgi:hypothetical protein